MKFRAADLFCGAGGAAMGLHRAGFEVEGWDIRPQPHYPFKFHLGDALAVDLTGFDFVWASPPCQAYTVAKSIRKRAHPELIEPIRVKLKASGLHYIIENVPGAPLISPLVLCGSMFKGLRVYRHRLFESDIFLWPPGADCSHGYTMPKSKGEYHTLDKQDFITCVGHNFQAKSGRVALGIDWMTRDEMAQAIPPAYSEFLGRQIIQCLTPAHNPLQCHE